MQISSNFSPHSITSSANHSNYNYSLGFSISSVPGFNSPNGARSNRQPISLYFQTQSNSLSTTQPNQNQHPLPQPPHSSAFTQTCSFGAGFYHGAPLVWFGGNDCSPNPPIPLMPILDQTPWFSILTQMSDLAGLRCAKGIKEFNTALFLLLTSDIMLSNQQTSTCLARWSRALFKTVHYKTNSFNQSLIGKKGLSINESFRSNVNHLLSDNNFVGSGSSFCNIGELFSRLTHRNGNISPGMLLGVVSGTYYLKSAHDQFIQYLQNKYGISQPERLLREYGFQLPNDSLYDMCVWTSEGVSCLGAINDPLNTSQQANVRFEIIRHRGMYFIAYFALRRITPGAHLWAKYGSEYWSVYKNTNHKVVTTLNHPLLKTETNQVSDYSGEVCIINPHTNTANSHHQTSIKKEPDSSNAIDFSTLHQLGQQFFQLEQKVHLSDAVDAVLSKKPSLLQPTLRIGQVSPTQSVSSVAAVKNLSNRSEPDAARSNRQNTRGKKERYHCSYDDHCDKSYKKKSALDAHIKTKHEKVGLECNICHQLFAYLSYLQNHMKSHKEKGEYKCKPCNKTYKQKSGLNFHIKKEHSNYSGFKCKACGHKSKTKYDAKVHNRIHTNEQPYKCSFCEKPFKQKSNLTQHLRIHTGEKPFKCNTCQKRFNSSSSRNRHIKRRHK